MLVLRGEDHRIERRKRGDRVRCRGSVRHLTPQRRNPHVEKLRVALGLQRVQLLTMSRRSRDRTTADHTSNAATITPASATPMATNGYDHRPAVRPFGWQCSIGSTQRLGCVVGILVRHVVAFFFVRCDGSALGAGWLAGRGIRLGRTLRMFSALMRRRSIECCCDARDQRARDFRFGTDVDPLFDVCA